MRRDVGANSLAGVSFTDRTTAGGFNRVAAADARIVFKKLYYVLGQVGGSWTDGNSARTAAPESAPKLMPDTLNSDSE